MSCLKKSECLRNILQLHHAAAHGSETMVIYLDILHAIWVFIVTEFLGAVYLVAVPASHAHVGIPVFGIYVLRCSGIC